MHSTHSFYKGKRVLITGGAGFLGSNLAVSLAPLGTEITVLDSFHPNYGANEFNLASIQSGIRVLRSDIRDQKATREAASQADVIFHIAAQCSHVDSMTEPFMDLAFNAEGTLSILEAARLSGRKPRVVYASTRAVSGTPLEMPVREKTLPNPVDIYGVNKHVGELYGAVYAKVHRIPCVSLRLTNCYGERHQMKSGKYGILNWFVSQALQGKPVKVFGTGDQLRDYLYVEDAVDAFLRAGAFDVEAASSDKVKLSGKGVPYAVFNVSSGKGIRFVDCAKKITEVAKSPLEYVPWPADRQAIETGDFVADSTPAKELLGWSPKTGFDEGLSKTFAYYRENLRHYL